MHLFIYILIENIAYRLGWEQVASKSCICLNVIVVCGLVESGGWNFLDTSDAMNLPRWCGNQSFGQNGTGGFVSYTDSDQLDRLLSKR